MAGMKRLAFLKILELSPARLLAGVTLQNGEAKTIDATGFLDAGTP